MWQESSGFKQHFDTHVAHEMLLSFCLISLCVKSDACNVWNLRMYVYVRTACMYVCTCAICTNLCIKFACACKRSCLKRVDSTRASDNQVCTLQTKLLVHVNHYPCTVCTVCAVRICKSLLTWMSCSGCRMYRNSASRQLVVIRTALWCMSFIEWLCHLVFEVQLVRQIRRTIWHLYVRMYTCVGITYVRMFVCFLLRNVCM